MTGYIKLHRKVWNSTIYSDPNMLKLWIHCLMKATHTEHNQLVGNSVIKLNPGEFVTGRNALADEYNKGASPAKKIKPLSLWRWLQTLEKMEMLNIKTTNKYSVISIVNWCEYQQNEQQVNNKSTTNEQQMITNKNVKNGEKGNKKTSSQKFSTSDMENAELLFKRMQQNNPNVKEPNFDKWANEFRLMREVDNRTDKQMKYMIEWSQKDPFWKTTTLSPGSIRKNFDRFVLLIQAEKEKKTNQPSYKPIEQPSPQYKPFNKDDFLRSE